MSIHYIAHRVNTLDELKALDTQFGVELDLRDSKDRLIMVHDPFSDGEDFAPYAKAYQHGTMILNIKSERIEHRVLEVVRQSNIKDYFFLDSSFPMIHLLASQGEKNCAIRFSEYEGLDTIMQMKGRVNWVWVDCFTKLPINTENYRQLKAAGFKLCLVSPELQGRPDDLLPYKAALAAEGIVFDAICTKSYNIEKWQA